MKKIVLFFIMLFVFCNGMVALAADEDVPLTATVTLTDAYTVGSTTNFIFGTVIADPGGDTLTYDASGLAAAPATGTTVTPTGTSAITSATDGDVASIEITTAINGITVGLNPIGSVDLTGSGSEVITMNNFNYNIPAVNTALATAGTYKIFIGADLVIPANTPPDTYDNTMTVTLTFN